MTKIDLLSITFSIVTLLPKGISVLSDACLPPVFACLHKSPTHTSPILPAFGQTFLGTWNFELQDVFLTRFT